MEQGFFLGPMNPLLFAAVVGFCVLRRDKRKLCIRKKFEVSPEKLRKFKKNGYVVIDSAISQHLLAACAREAELLRNDMKPGKISRGLDLEDGQTAVSVVRSDKMLWLKNQSSSRTAALYLVQQKLVNLRMELNKTILSSFETSTDKCAFMLAVYPGEGKGYKRHKDATENGGRKLTAIVYLNSDWDKRFGGCLRIWGKNASGPAPDTIEPVGGRLVIFFSNLWHEVLPLHYNFHRTALSAFFINKQDLAKEILGEERTVQEEKERNRAEFLEMVAKKIALRKLLGKKKRERKK